MTTDKELNDCEHRVWDIVKGLSKPSEAMSVLANVLTAMALALNDGREEAVHDMYLDLANYHSRRAEDGPLH
jgi:hypothetical protein